MESGERLSPTSSAPSSFQVASSSAGSSPAPPQTPSTKCSLAPNLVASSPLNTCGTPPQTTGDKCLNVSDKSKGFPLLSHPAFGLFASASGRSEFGGLGSLGLSAFAAHPQLGALPDWWWQSEAHARGAAAFFPPLLGLHPAFASNFKSQDPVHPQSSVSVGVNGTVNGLSGSSPTGKSPVDASSSPVNGNKDRIKASSCPKSSQALGRQQMIQKTKEKKPNRRPFETLSVSGSHSGSLSDSSSDGEESSSDDKEEEDDDDNDEDDQSDDSDESDFETETQDKQKVMRLTQNTSESKKRRPCTSDGNTARDSRGDAVSLTSALHLAASSNPAALFLQSLRAAEDEGQKHISVIQATGAAASCSGSSSGSPFPQAHRVNSPLPTRSSPKPISFSNSPKHLPPSASPKPLSLLPSPKLVSSSSSSSSPSPKPLALCSPLKPPSLSSPPKPPFMSSPKPPPFSASPKSPLASQRPSHKQRIVMPSPKHTKPIASLKEPSGNLPDGMSSHFNNFKLKQPVHPKDSPKQPFSLQPSSQKSSDTNLFLSHRTNGAIHGEVQDAPLALITKPRTPSATPNNKPLLASTSPSYAMPINLSMGAKELSSSSSSPLKSVTSPQPAHRSRKSKSPKSLHEGRSTPKAQPADLVRSSESDIHSGKDSDSDSMGDDFDEDDEDDMEEDDSGSSLSESESDLESDSDNSEDDMKERAETEADSDAESSPLELTTPLSAHKSSSSSFSASSPLLNLPVITAPSLPSSLLSPTRLSSSGALSNHSTPSPSFSLSTMQGSGKRRRVTDERVLRLPLEFGWQRETRMRTVAGRLQGEVAYFAPCGKKLRQYPDVMKYLLRNGINEISRDNFSFSTKIKVGDFYEARDGPEGPQWCLLPEEEITPRIIAMDGRRSRRTQSEQQLAGDGAGNQKWKGQPLNAGDNNNQDVTNAKLLRKLEAQEIARQAAQIKLMRKLEKQAMAQAAKEARRKQAMMAAEERRKKREQLKILKQQEKIKRIQQIRLEKELRAQQILEAKRKKKEEAANARILEAEKRIKEKEMQRLQAVIMKHQELERHRLDMVWERERRRQHMMLMKAVETRKKAEEKERLRKEKKDEKRLNKERKLELRRLELEKAKELKKPNEDMCLADHKLLPELSRIPGLVLSASTFSDCLMVLQFVRSFRKVLGLDVHSNNPSLGDLQEGLLNMADSVGKVQDLLVSMVSAAVRDPGIPAGHKSKTSLGEHLTNVDINRDNVSEILQIYMDSHCEHSAEAAALALSLRTKAFQAHSPSQKAAMLTFLVNELCCSKAVVSEIDKNIDLMTNLRKDKWAIEGKLRKLRSIHTKRTGKRDMTVRGEDGHTSVIPTARNKCKRKEGDSDEEDDDDEDSEDQGDDDEEEEEDTGGKKGKKAEICEEEDDSVQPASVEDLEKQIEKTYRQQIQIRQKLLNSSHCLRSMMIGQDRYKRQYWVLPQCGGIFVEGVESSEGGYEELEDENERQEDSPVNRIKEEQLEDTKMAALSSPALSTDRDTATPESQQDKDSLNLFLQKPGSLSKLSKLLEVAKMASHIDPLYRQNSYSTKAACSASYPAHLSAQTGISLSPQPANTQQGLADKADASLSPPGVSLPKGSHWLTFNPSSVPQDDQLAKALMEKSTQWFSLLPRSPCDESSVTSGSSAPASSSSPHTASTKSPSSPSPNPRATAGYSVPAEINNMQSAVLQQAKSGVHQSRLRPCDGSNAATSPSLPCPGASPPSVLDLASQHAEGNRNRLSNLVNNNTVNNSETPEALSDKPPCATHPTVEAAKSQDYPRPRPIPEEMMHGWWRMSSVQELHSLVDALHSRGARERVLQKQFQKHMEYMAQLCADRKDAIDVAELKKQDVSEKTVEGWCVEEQAMEVDIALLQRVEALERRVVSGSLQIKGWMHPEPQSERGDLVYHEHKLISSPAPEDKCQRESSAEEPPGSVVRRPNNPLDIAVFRLAELESNIERSEEEAAAPGMRLWHKALGEVRSSAQLSLCIQQLQKSIAWERSIMKVHCHRCQKGDNEELLLLCDGCDKGCHTYCHKPKITTVPDGDWFCPTCVAKESGQSVWSRKQQNQTAGGGKRGSDVKRNSKPSVVAELIKDEAASSSSSSSSSPKKGSKEFKRRKRDDSPPSSQAGDSAASCAKKAKVANDDTNGLAMCSVLLAELEAHQDAWPFLTPVNSKSVPGYKKVIKKPMDFSTIRDKLTNNQYLNLETFIIDVNLVFDNCEKFNEDNSAIGQAGHNMRSFFDKRWTELLQ